MQFFSSFVIDFLIVDNNIFVFLTFFKFFNYTQLSRIFSFWDETRFVSWSFCFKHSITIIVFTQWIFYSKFSKKTNQNQNSNVFVFTSTFSLIYLQHHKNLQQSYRHNNHCRQFLNFSSDWFRFFSMFLFVDLLIIKIYLCICIFRALSNKSHEFWFLMLFFSYFFSFSYLFHNFSFSTFT